MEAQSASGNVLEDDEDTYDMHASCVLMNQNQQATLDMENETNNTESIKAISKVKFSYKESVISDVRGTSYVHQYSLKHILVC